MAEIRLHQELNESKLEIVRLRELVSLGAPTVVKNLSLIALVPRCSGSESTNSLEEFISSVEAYARICLWEDQDKVEIAVLKLEVAARVFYQCVQSSTRETRRGKISKICSVNSTYTSTRIRTLTQGYIWPVKARMKGHRILRTGAGS
jgi:hypothetical protein